MADEIINGLIQRQVDVAMERIAAAKDAEIERLQELVRGVGASRYWEGRWRDAKAEIERLEAQVERLLGRAHEGVMSERERCVQVVMNTPSPLTWIAREKLCDEIRKGE